MYEIVNKSNKAISNNTVITAIMDIYSGWFIIISTETNTINDLDMLCLPCVLCNLYAWPQLIQMIN